MGKGTFQNRSIAASIADSFFLKHHMIERPAIFHAERSVCFYDRDTGSLFLQGIYPFYPITT